MAGYDQDTRRQVAKILREMDPTIRTQLLNPVTELRVHDLHRPGPGGGWQADGATLYVNGVPRARIDRQLRTVKL